MRNFLLQGVVCFIVAGMLLYRTIYERTLLIELSVQLPMISREIEEIQEKNLELELRVREFESPQNLWRLARLPEHRHLKIVPSCSIDLLATPDAQ